MSKYGLTRDRERARSDVHRERGTRTPPRVQADGSFGPIPPPTKRGYFDIVDYPALMRPGRDKKVAQTKATLTVAGRREALALERQSHAHLDVCASCETLFDAFVHMQWTDVDVEIT